MKKILIFGLARTGTTLLQQHLAQSLSIKSYSEPFGDKKFRDSLGNPYQWASQLSKCVIKVLPQNLDYVDLVSLIQQGSFDSVVITQRQNLTDICVSLYYAEQVANRYHYQIPPDPNSIKPFLVTREFVDGFLVSYGWYHDTMQQIAQQSIAYTVFDYDLYQRGESQKICDLKFCLASEPSYHIVTVASKIDYQQLCANYNEIDLIIKNENNRQNKSDHIPPSVGMA